MKGKDDAVGFASGKKPPLPTKIKDARDVLSAAVLAAGDDVLTKFEEEFAEDNLNLIDRYGAEYDLTFNRQQTIDRIEGKLEKEGLI